MLSQEQVNFYNENGYLHIPQMFTPEETNQLSDELDRLVQEWAFTSEGWTGPWRQVYMDPDTEKKSKLTAMHDLQFYSAPWLRAVTNPRTGETVRVKSKRLPFFKTGKGLRERLNKAG